jgi:predicted AAA+ superfamily ATPase
MPPHEEGAIASLFDEYVSFGGYPPVVLSTDAEQKLQMLHEIFDTVIQRDMMERHRIRREKKAENHLALVQLACCIIVCRRKALG